MSSGTHHQHCSVRDSSLCPVWSRQLNRPQCRRRRESYARRGVGQGAGAALMCNSADHAAGRGERAPRRAGQGWSHSLRPLAC